MSVLSNKVAVHEAAEINRFVDAARCVEAEAYRQDPVTGGRFCVYCGVYQNSEHPNHTDYCPVSVIALAAERMSRKEVAA